MRDAFDVALLRLFRRPGGRPGQRSAPTAACAASRLTRSSRSTARTARSTAPKTSPRSVRGARRRAAGQGGHGTAPVRRADSWCGRGKLGRVAGSTFTNVLRSHQACESMRFRGSVRGRGDKSSLPVQRARPTCLGRGTAVLRPQGGTPGALANGATRWYKRWISFVWLLMKVSSMGVRAVL